MAENEPQFDILHNIEEHGDAVLPKTKSDGDFGILHDADKKIQFPELSLHNLKNEEISSKAQELVTHYLEEADRNSTAITYQWIIYKLVFILAYWLSELISIAFMVLTIFCYVALAIATIFITVVVNLHQVCTDDANEANDEKLKAEKWKIHQELST